MGFHVTDHVIDDTRDAQPRAAVNPLRGPIRKVESGYRFYAPEMGRWINRDPIGERGGLNLYAFAVNDPVARYDILGLLGCFECGEWENVGEPYWENTGSSLTMGARDCSYKQYQDKSKPCRFCCIPYTKPGRDEVGSGGSLCQGYAACPDSPDDPNCVRYQ